MYEWGWSKQLEELTAKLLSPYYLRIFPDMLTFYSHQKEKYPYDKDIYLKDGTIYRIEEKVNSKKHINTGNIVFEEISNVEAQHMGWIYYSQADFMVTTWSDGYILYKGIYVYWMQPMLDWYKRNRAKYRHVIIDGGLYKTKMSLVPIEDLDPFLYTEINIY
jgi:hypothetical protein